MEAAEAYAAKTDVPIETVVVGPGRNVEDIYQEWTDIREVDVDGFLPTISFAQCYEMCYFFID